ncbi:MAG: hypothetical protein K0S49_2472 [Microbacterium sp.]|nr:hypothetical protein [Microbacterium sp.]
MIAVVVVLVRRRRSGAGGSARGAAAEPIESLARRSASALVAADDAIRTSEQELGFATAQFGDDAAAAFAQTLAQARRDLDEAFSLQQRLDDDQPDTEADVRAIHTRILELCAHADSELDARADEFDRLRDLEQNAPEALVRIQQDRAAAGTGLDGAIASLERLRSAYAPEELATIGDNPDQARSRLTYADEQLDAAQRAIAAGDGASAAIALRAAEGAVAQAAQLEASVEKVAADLATAERDAAALVTELEQDVAAAVGVPDPDGSLGAVASATRQQIDAARAQLTGEHRRPQAALSTLLGANSAIDAALAGARDAAQRAARARQTLDQQLQQARAQVSAAEDYIGTRRGAVGATARTRVAEARASLDRAEATSQIEPERALADATRATQLSRLAIDAARTDVGGFTSASAGSNSSGMMGAMIGGMVLNSLLGARPHRRWWIRRRRSLPPRRRPLLTISPSSVPTTKGTPMAKQSIFGRISTLMKANINALLDQAEDPQKMLDQLVRDYTNSIADAESAIAETIGNLRLLERDHQEDVQAAAEWGNKALAASRKADELRAVGNTADADKFDNLAKVALQRQISEENEARTIAPTIATQTEVVEKLKDGLNGMKVKLDQLRAKRSELLARAKTAEAQNRVHDAVKSIDVLDPTSELGRFEDKVRRQEALAAGKQELAASSLDAQFESLEDVGQLTEVEARLAALKTGGAAGAIER